MTESTNFKLSNKAKQLIDQKLDQNLKHFQKETNFNEVTPDPLIFHLDWHNQDFYKYVVDVDSYFEAALVDDPITKKCLSELTGDDLRHPISDAVYKYLYKKLQSKDDVLLYIDAMYPIIENPVTSKFMMINEQVKANNQAIFKLFNNLKKKYSKKFKIEMHILDHSARSYYCKPVKDQFFIKIGASKYDTLMTIKADDSENFSINICDHDFAWSLNGVNNDLLTNLTALQYDVISYLQLNSN